MVGKYLFIYDLDYTIWEPEMYQLCGAPRLKDIDKLKLDEKTLERAKTNVPGKVLVDGDDTPITVFPGASLSISMISKMRDEGENIDIAVASRCDEPKWAAICMRHLVVANGKTLTDIISPDHVVINSFNKERHIKELHKRSGVDYDHMVFFDNEQTNFTRVKPLGVKCIYTPRGMSTDAWKEGLDYCKLSN